MSEEVKPGFRAIGVVAYEALPPLLVFVRVPNERGRYLITHKCVTAVACPVCEAVIGEPCRNTKNVDSSRLRYWCDTHVARRDTWRYSTDKRHRPPLRISAGDVMTAQGDANTDLSD